MTDQTSFTPPIARKDHHETVLHGITLSDDYAWLRDKENPEVTAYLNAENAYAEADTADLAPLRDQLYNEMLSHIKQTDESAPYREGDWWYYIRTEEGKQYSIFCRKRASDTNPDAPSSPGAPSLTAASSLSRVGDRNTQPGPDAPENIILDGNQLAEGQAFFSIGATDISDDGRWLAYTVDFTGFRQYTLHIKDLKTGETLPGKVERVGSVTWASDNITLLYSVEDEEQKRQFQLFRHTLHAPHASDVLVYQDDDERFNIGAGRTRDGKFIILESGSHTTTECRVLPADQPSGEFILISPREDEHEYSVDHRNGQWFIRTNDRGRNFRLVTAPLNAPTRENWVERIPHRDTVMLEDIDLFANFFVACEREDGLPRLRLWKFQDETPDANPAGEIAFPEPAYSASSGINRIWETKLFRYGYQSLVTPGSVYEYDLETRQSDLLKQQEVPGGFDRTLYASERIHATAPDGVQVPISLVYRRDRFAKNLGAPSSTQSSRVESGKAQDSTSHDANRSPLYVYGYGSYGYALPLGFNSNRLSLLDRGIVIAYAHIRGGGDLGKPWHDAGKMLVKLNTFTDFISATVHLTANGYGDPARVAIEGGSAGGLLMGAVTNLRPDLFRAVLSHVPFVDVMNTMLDASLPLTVPEYEEWGDPNQEAYFKYMLSYSPYDNLKSASYPAMLVKTSLNDSQVMYWEPAKYVAKLRALKTDGNPLLLVTNMEAGHGGASGRYDYLKEIAFDYAFLLRELGLLS
ncbi:MAG TPA: S9 family peptidase [Terracidiphilus sp.]|nr:S9 family peptidase [Terracidiphilus sp.]